MCMLILFLQHLALYKNTHSHTYMYNCIVWPHLYTIHINALTNICIYNCTVWLHLYPIHIVLAAPEPTRKP
jgi:hypothetical protein